MSVKMDRRCRENYFWKLDVGNFIQMQITELQDECSVIRWLEDFFIFGHL